MKAIKILTIAVLLVFTGQSYAQQTGRTQASSIEPYALGITTDKTTSLVFPYPIKSVDKGTRDVLAQKAIGVENILQLKAAKADFAPTNLTVITADGNLFSYVLTYTPEPLALNIKFDDQKIVADPLAVFSPDATNAVVKENTGKVAVRKRSISRLSDKKFDMQLDIKGIYIQDGVLYFQFYFHNSSALNYDVQLLRFYIKDKKRAKRTASQEVEIEPLYIAGNIDRIRSRSEQTITVAVPKITVPDKKYLSVELMEKDGGRHLSLKVHNKDILKAAPIL